MPVTGFCLEKADLVLVVKSESKLYLLKDGEVLDEFHAVFGTNPEGHKVMEGDEKTPEGFYILEHKKEDSAFYKAIRISYPNEQDIRRARQLGVSPGGKIMIHGQRNGFDWLSLLTQKSNWTDGCIALFNRDMDIVWQKVDEGTPIEIRP
jgi:murein L,D-transpeptidase YafK